MVCKAAGIRCVIEGQDVYLEEQEQIVGRIMSRVWFWKADLETVITETNEESNEVGQ